MYIRAIWLCVALLPALLSPLPASAGEEDAILALADLNGKRLGTVAGTVLDAAADEALDFTDFYYYDTNEQLYGALYSGEIDAVIDDEPVVRYRASSDPLLRALPGTLVPDRYGYALRMDDLKLYHRVNTALTHLLEEGVMDTLEARGLEGPDSGRVLPEPAAAPDDAEVLRVGVSSISPPFCYRNGEGDLVGLDLELLQLLAERIGMRLVVTDMDFGLMIPTLLDGHVDLIGGCFSISDERARLVRFTDSYYAGGIGALVLR